MRRLHGVCFLQAVAKYMVNDFAALEGTANASKPVSWSGMRYMIAEVIPLLWAILLYVCVTQSKYFVVCVLFFCLFQKTT